MLLPKSFKEELISIVGKKNFSEALIDQVSSSMDFSGYRHDPEGTVWPTTTEQVAKIMALANREKIPVTPRGAGTGATGMAVPIRGGIVLDLVRMNKILSISIEDRLAVVQPGVVYADLQKTLSLSGFCFPPDPASGKVATIGGNVATNAGGIKGAKYGTTRDYVLGLEVVLPDGRIMRTGGSCMKSVSGFDLTRLMVGSEGLLGVITEIRLKINPIPIATATALGAFEQLGQAGQAVSQIMHSGIIPSVCEILDRYTIDLLLEHTSVDLPRCAALILVETDGTTQAEADFQIGKIIEVFQKNQAVLIKQAGTAAEAAGLWQARKSLGSVLTRAKPNFLVEDVTVPMGRITDLLLGIEAIAQKYGLDFITFGHAGDGNLHPHALYDGSNQDEVRRVEQAAADLFKLACDLGGTLTGEHGIGLSKASFMNLEHDPVALEVMASLKKLFDPNHILNPGKMGLAGC
jgi:glycolate oxidase